MTPFLYAVAEAFYREYGRRISEHIASLSEEPLFSPGITTINDLFFK